MLTNDNQHASEKLNQDARATAESYLRSMASELRRALLTAKRVGVVSIREILQKGLEDTGFDLERERGHGR
jgi:hypothetical protein